MKRKLRVLYVCSECNPYIAFGELGEAGEKIVGTMSQQVDFRRIIPLHKGATCNLRYKWDYSIPMGWMYHTALVKMDSDDKKNPTYFICNDLYYNRVNMYGNYDDGERFLFFCKSIVKLIKESSFKPDIVHCHDWHTGLVPLLLKKEGIDCKTIYSVNNYKCNGWIGQDYVNELSLQDDEKRDILTNGYVDFMAAGLAFSDCVSANNQAALKKLGTGSKGIVCGGKKFNYEKLYRDLIAQ